MDNFSCFLNFSWCVMSPPVVCLYCQPCINFEMEEVEQGDLQFSVLVNHVEITTYIWFAILCLKRIPYFHCFTISDVEISGPDLHLCNCIQYSRVLKLLSRKPQYHLSMNVTLFNVEMFHIRCSHFYFWDNF